MLLSSITVLGCKLKTCEESVVSEKNRRRSPPFMRVLKMEYLKNLVNTVFSDFI